MTGRFALVAIATAVVVQALVLVGYRPQSRAVLWTTAATTGVVLIIVNVLLTAGNTP